MTTSKTFSLRSLFLWCTVAAVFLAIVGLGFRGVDWAVGASWALLGALITIACIGVLYWVAHFLALLLETIAPVTMRGAVPPPPPPGLVPAVNAGDESRSDAAVHNPETLP